MINQVARKLGRRKAGTWGKPHLRLRTRANRAVRRILKRLLQGGRCR